MRSYGRQRCILDFLVGYEIEKRLKVIDQFKARVALEALHGDRTIQEIAAKHWVHPNQVSTRKRPAIGGMAGVVTGGGKPDGPTEAEAKELYAKIKRLTVEPDFLSADLKR